MFEETTTRSLAKAISWRVLATLTTMLLVFVFTARVDVAVTIGVLEMLVKIILYFFHERLWNKASIGRRELPVVSPEPGRLTVERALEGPDSEGLPGAGRDQSVHPRELAHE